MGMSPKGIVFYGFWEYPEEDGRVLDEISNERWKEFSDKLEELNLDYSFAGYGDGDSTLVIHDRTNFESEWGNMVEIDIESLQEGFYLKDAKERLETFITHFELPKEYKNRIKWYVTSYYG